MAEHDLRTDIFADVMKLFKKGPGLIAGSQLHLVQGKDAVSQGWEPGQDSLRFWAILSALTNASR